MAWYNASWTYRVKVTVDNTKVDADLTDYSVYIDLSDLPADFHANVNSTDARDIRVTKADGTTELPREVVSYDAATGTGELHFKASGVLSSSVDTDYYIYYGNAAATEPAPADTYGSQNVWDSNYKLVDHQTDDTTSATKDSTSNGNDLVKVRVNEPIEATGKVGKAQSFDGVDDYSKTTNVIISSPAKLTVSAWINKESGGSTYETALHHASNQYIGTSSYWLGVDDADALVITLGASVAGIGWAAGQTTITAVYGQWYLLTAVWDGTVVKVYVDGIYQKQYNLASYPALSTPTRAGHSSDDGYYRFAGGVDEVRLQVTDRSGSWVLTEYNNQSSPSTFYAVSTQEIDSTTTTSSVTKSLQYTIKTTPAATTKSLSYEVTTNTAVTKSLVYKINSSVAVTKSLEYVLASNTSATKSLRYAIITTPPSGVDTYYFDGSDAAASDPDGVWNNDANAFDGSEATYADSASSGSTTSNNLTATGTNAPSSGGAISQVRARVFGKLVEAPPTIYCDISYSGASLGTPINSNGGAQPIWGTYVTLTAPSGGWTWAKLQALKANIYISTNFAHSVYKIEIEVTSSGGGVSKPLSYEINNKVAVTKSLKYTVNSSSVATKSLRYTVKTTKTLGIASVSTYYFDASNGASTDAGWSNKANATDGSLSTEASTTTYGTSTLTLFGTNAPGSGGTINSVRARVYGRHWSNFDDVLLIYTEAKVEQILPSISSGSTPASDTVSDWSSWFNVNTPSGGWTWAKLQTLEAVMTYDAGISGSRDGSIHRIEVEVTFDSAPELKYAVAPSTTQTKSLKYAVDSNVSVTKSLQYTIDTFASTTKSLQYAITPSTAITKSLRYTIDSSVNIAKSLQYEVITSVAITKSLGYSMQTTPTATTKSLQYSVATSAPVSKSLAYAVTTPTSTTKSLRYMVNASTSLTVSLRYTVADIASITKSLRYAVVASAGTSRNLRYTVNINTPITKALAYTVTADVQTTIARALAYSVNTSTPITKSLSYSAQTTSSSTKLLKYSLTTVLPITKSLSYAITTSISASKSLSYSITLSTPITKSLVYNVASEIQITITKSLSYYISSAIPITKSLQYAAMPETAVTKSLKYTVLSVPAAETLALKYVVGIKPGNKTMLRASNNRHGVGYLKPKSKNTIM